MELKINHYKNYVDNYMKILLRKNIYNENILTVFKQHINILYQECPDEFKPNYFAPILSNILEVDYTIQDQIKMINMVYDYGTHFSKCVYNNSQAITLKILDTEFLETLIKGKFPFNTILVNNPLAYTLLNKYGLLNVTSKKNILLLAMEENEELCYTIFNDTDIKKIIKLITYSIKYSMENVNSEIVKKMLSIDSFNINDTGIGKILYHLYNYNRLDLYTLFINYILTKPEYFCGTICGVPYHRCLNDIIKTQKFDYLKITYELFKNNEDSILINIYKCYKSKWKHGLSLLMDNPNKITLDMDSWTHDKFIKFLDKLKKNKDPFYKAMHEKLLLKFIINSP